MRKKLVAAVLCLSAIWMFTGCGQEGTVESGTDTAMEESSAAVTAQGSAEQTPTESKTEESTQEVSEGASEEENRETNDLSGGYAFGEEAAVTEGDELVFADHYKVKIGSFQEWYDGTIAMEIEVQDGTTTHSYFLNRSPEGVDSEFSRDKVITEYKLVLKDISLEGGTFTMVERVFPEPMVLSGNPEDVYHMDDYQYVIGDKVDLFFDKDIDVSGDTLVLVEQVMSDLEEMTGLKFYNDSRYQGLNSEGTREAYFGMDPWNGYEYYNRDRVAVYFIHDREKKGLIANACGFSMVLVDEDFDFRQCSLNTLGHEMAHILDRANHDNFTQVMTEGFGSYWGRRASILHPEFIVGDNLEYGPDHEFYWYMQKPITAGSAEKLYNDNYDRMSNADYYDYGFQLMTYLYENYPLEKINDFYEKLSDEIWAYRLANDEDALDLVNAGYLGDASTPELEMEFMKTYWGQDFFEKFGTWDRENKKRFGE